MFVCLDDYGRAGSGDTPQEAYEDYLNSNNENAADLTWVEGQEITVQLVKVVKQELVKSKKRRDESTD